ncbi:4-phosphopantetheinyl transferase [Limnospira fusiformis CCALA 023]|uniref:4'-phosphopantetheinyl transferase family protein n=1 Tax=Arthrospira sp. PCC 8006 TaxID=1982224 RepID=UPI00396E65F3
MFQRVDLTPFGDDAIAPHVEVWQADLDLHLSQIAGLERLLSAEERQRAAAFRRESDRLHFTAARGILRQILASYVGVAPPGLEFAYSQRGKPGLITGNSQGEIQFNLSHSHGKALYAIAFNRRVGIDLEKIRSLDGLTLAKRFFCEGEYSQLSNHPKAAQNRAFFQLWTAKEALLKATGTGLIGLKDVEILPNNDGQLFLAKIVGNYPHNWYLKTWEIDNWAAAIAVETLK